MKTTEEVLTQNPGMHIWSDKETIDITVNDETKTFLEELGVFKCPYCDVLISEVNGEKIKAVTDSVFGMNLTCKCKQKMYIHKPILIPKNLTN